MLVKFRVKFRIQFLQVFNGVDFGPVLLDWLAFVHASYVVDQIQNFLFVFLGLLLIMDGLAGPG